MIRRLAVLALALSLAIGVPSTPAATAASAATAETSGCADGPLMRKAQGLDGSSAASPDDDGLAALASSGLDALPIPAAPFAVPRLAQGENQLYAIDMQAGERLSISVTSTDGEFDAYLYAPGLGLLSQATAIAHASEGSYPRGFSYDVPADISGTYYLEMYAYEGDGACAVDWSVTPASERARKDVPSAVSVALPLDRTITIADSLQANDLVVFYAAGSRRVSIDVAGPAGADFDAYLYGPGTDSIIPSYVEPVAWGNGNTANESFVFDVPMGSAGLYYLEVIRFSGSGDARVRVSQSGLPPAPTATRIAGASRFDTAIEVARRTHPAGSRTAVLCSGRSFPDGLSASSLAGALDAPILLTEQNRLPDNVGRQLKAMGTDTVYVVGGASAVGFAVESDLARWVPGITITRVAGASRYETAGEVADWVHGILGQRPDRVFLASGFAFPDALALSPLAYSLHAPILLTAPTDLPPATKAAIDRARGTSARRVDVLVAGGASAVSAQVASAAASSAGGTLTRAHGPSRYDTALAIAEHAIASGWAGPENVAVASGITFPDSLGGASLPGSRGGVLLLCPATTLGPSSTAFMKSFDFRIDETWALGGAAAVTEPVLGEIRGILPDAPHAH